MAKRAGHKMISKEQVNLAVAAANDAIKEGAKFAWIKKSALLERAYHCGLYAGLCRISSEDHLKGFFLHALVNTMYARRGDDTFSSTSIGRAYDVLKRYLLREHSGFSLLGETCDDLLSQIEKLDELWRSTLNHAKELIGGVKNIQGQSTFRSDGATTHQISDEMQDQTYRLLEGLEHCLRIIALLETDHRRWKFLED